MPAALEVPNKIARDIPPPLELECLKALWTMGEGNVKDVRRALAANRNLAYTTVMTVMNRLLAKNILARHGERRSYVYEATAADAAGIAVQNVIRTYGDAAVTHFVDEARADPGVLRRLRSLLAEDR